MLKLGGLIGKNNNSKMKKVSLMILVLLVSGFTSICSAQGKITVWYGANLSNVSFEGESADRTDRGTADRSLF